MIQPPTYPTYSCRNCGKPCPMGQTNCDPCNKKLIETRDMIRKGVADKPTKF